MLSAKRVLTLSEPQIPMVDFMRHTPRCGLWAGMGIGKSSAALYAMDLLRIMGEVGQEPGLILGPMRVARDTWPEEVAKWDNFKHLKIVPLVECGPRERADRLKSKSVDFFTVNYEVVDWLVDHYMEKWPFRIVIADESDRLQGLREKSHGIKLRNADGETSKKKGGGAARAFAIAKVAHNLVDRWINLTGTPAPQGLQALWGQTWYLDKGERLGRTFGAFMQRWWRKKWSGYGVEPCPFAYEQIHAALRDICLTIDPKDYFDLREPIYRRIEVNLPPQARAMYKDMEDDAYLEIEELGVEINAVNAGAVMTKLMQLAGGAIYTQRPLWVPVHNAKMEALDSLIHETGGDPMIIAYAYKHEKERIMKAYPKCVDLATQAGKAKFRAGGAALGIAHPKSMGHGVDGLQDTCSTICFFGHDWKTGEREQLIARCGPMRLYHAGNDRVLKLYDIVARKTEDEHAMLVHERNGDVQSVLLEAMKRRKLC
jgi:hypothetical protein